MSGVKIEASCGPHSISEVLVYTIKEDVGTISLRIGTISVRVGIISVHVGIIDENVNGNEGHVATNDGNCDVNWQRSWTILKNTRAMHRAMRFPRLQALAPLISSVN
jgi:hypothetical protein